jgi:signal transduction histidine kinase
MHTHGSNSGGLMAFRGLVSRWREHLVPVAFAAVTLPVFVLVGVLMVHTEQEGATVSMVRASQDQTVGLARSVANAHAESIAYLLAFERDDGPDQLPLAVGQSGMASGVAASIVGTNIVDVRLYDASGIMLFSLDQSQLGTSIADCACFAVTIGGQAFSELLLAADNERMSSAQGADGDTVVPDLLSTMIPVRVTSQELSAEPSVLEIMTDVSPLVDEIAATRRKVAFDVGMPLALLYLIMVATVVVGHAAIRRRDRRAARLAVRAAESEAASDAKSEFLSLMSHELRTPLNAIIGFAHLIRNNAPDASEEASFAGAIESSGQHMLQLIANILDMTAIELGEYELTREMLDVGDVMRVAADNMRNAFDERLVLLDVLEGSTPEPVLGDSDRLRQVLEGLLGNAARLTPAGGTVTVRCGQVSGMHAYVRITDSGVGMTREEIERARLPFTKEWDGSERDAAGPGIGFSIADRIVTRLGGDISIESAVGSGTTITVRLPVHREAPVSEAGLDEVRAA